LSVRVLARQHSRQQQHPCKYSVNGPHNYTPR
jgi:hypothetical protein